MSIRAEILEEIQIDLDRLLDDDVSFVFAEHSELPRNITSPTALAKSKTPLLLVGDLGVERLVTRAPDGSRFAAEFLLRPLVSPDSPADIWNQLSDSIFAIRDWLHLAPTDAQIHANVTRFIYSNTRINRISEQLLAGDSLIEATLHYYESRTAPTLDYVYGSDIAKTGMDLIIAQLALLDAEIGSSVPGFDNVYEGHEYAGLHPTAITVQLEDASEETDGWSGDVRVAWRPRYSIRVITDVMGGERDSQRVMYLLQSIANWFKAHICLTDDVRVDDVTIASVGVNFEDVELYGGELILTTRESIIHTQA